MKMPKLVGVCVSNASVPHAWSAACVEIGGVVPVAYRMTGRQWLKMTDCVESNNLAYDCPAGRNDCFVYVNGADGGLENFHVHVFDSFDGNAKASGVLTITKLLPKSGSFRTGKQLDLTKFPLSEWDARVQDMDGKTQAAVAGLRNCFQSVNATFIP